MVSAKDLGSAGKIGSLSLTSSYVLRGQSGDLAIGNMIGHYRTLGGRLNGVDTGSGIANTVLRNGLLWSMPAPAWLGFGRSVEARFVNTHYTGTALYLRNYSELGLDVGTNKRADSTRGYMQGGLSLIVSSKTSGPYSSWNSTSTGSSGSKSRMSSWKTSMRGSSATLARRRSCITPLRSTA